MVATSKWRFDCFTFFSPAQNPVAMEIIVCLQHVQLHCCLSFAVWTSCRACLASEIFIFDFDNKSS